MKANAGKEADPGKETERSAEESQEGVTMVTYSATGPDVEIERRIRAVRREREASTQDEMRIDATSP